jgi:hypothetical protein
MISAALLRPATSGIQRRPLPLGCTIATAIIDCVAHAREPVGRELRAANKMQKSIDPGNPNVRGAGVPSCSARRVHLTQNQGHFH